MPRRLLPSQTQHSTHSPTEVEGNRPVPSKDGGVVDSDSLRISGLPADLSTESEPCRESTADKPPVPLAAASQATPQPKAGKGLAGNGGGDDPARGAS